MCCLGRCHENRAFQYAGVNHSAKTNDQIDAILKNPADHTGADAYRVGSNLDTPLLTAEFPGMEPFYALLKDLLKRTPEELLEDVKASRIRGRGGASFPAGTKWQTCRQAPGTPKFIVCNADEGDPGAYTDRYLLEQQPHLVLFGMILAGYLVGADTGIVYIRAEYPESVAAINHALDELRVTKYLGKNICGVGSIFASRSSRAPAPTSAARRLLCWPPSKASAPKSASSPPFPPSKGSIESPPSLTTSKPSR